MARPTQDAIDSFMSITGASESLAVRKLEECGGNLNEAINAHFGEVDRHVTNPSSAASLPASSQYMYTNDQIQPGPRGLLPLLAAVRSFKPSLLLDPNFRRDFFNRVGASAFPSRGPVMSHSGEIGEVPRRFSSGNEQPYHSGVQWTEDVTGTSLSRGQEIHGHGNDIEEEMIQAAIEASKREAERNDLNQQYSRSNDSSGIGLPQRQLHLEDDFSHAVSLSLKTAEQENAMREQQVKNKDQEAGLYDSIGRNEKAKTSGLKLNSGSSSHHDGAKNVEEQPAWGGLSSEELDEAAMLEATIFGEIPEGSSNRFQYAPRLQSGQDRSFSPSPSSVPHPASPSLTAQQLLRQQQDEEYLVSLLADKEKEINALKKFKTHCLKEEESCNKLHEGEELERKLVAKEASLPPEPTVDDKNAVTLLVRMPDGSRRGRRFLKSDKLQLLFDFIDVGRVVKPGTYRLVRPYPRRAFSVGDSSLTLSEVGLTSKQEAMFLELI